MRAVIGRVMVGTREVLGVPSAASGAGEAKAWALSTPLLRFVPGSWIVGLLVFALAGCLIGAAALYGLAVVSARTAELHPPATGRAVDGDEEPSVVRGNWRNAVCCRDTR